MGISRPAQTALIVVILVLAGCAGSSATTTATSDTKPELLAALDVTVSPAPGDPMLAQGSTFEFASFAGEDVEVVYRRTWNLSAWRGEDGDVIYSLYMTSPLDERGTQVDCPAEGYLSSHTSDGRLVYSKTPPTPDPRDVAGGQCEAPVVVLPSEEILFADSLGVQATDDGFVLETTDGRQAVFIAD